MCNNNNNVRRIKQEEISRCGSAAALLPRFDATARLKRQWAQASTWLFSIFTAATHTKKSTLQTDGSQRCSDGHQQEFQAIMRCASYGSVEPRVATAALSRSKIGRDGCDAHPAAEATYSSSAPENSYNQIRSTARHAQGPS